jgi:hypothetical protein
MVVSYCRRGLALFSNKFETGKLTRENTNDLRGGQWDALLFSHLL